MLKRNVTGSCNSKELDGKMLKGGLEHAQWLEPKILKCSARVNMLNLRKVNMLNSNAQVKMLHPGHAKVFK